MRHRKRTFKLGRTGSHRRALMANMTKAFVVCDRIETTVAKAKELKRFSEKMVTLAKKGTLSAERKAIQKMQISFNKLDTEGRKAAKNGDLKGYNHDRLVMPKLKELAARFKDRNGGYTRLVRTGMRRGDAAEMCVLEFLPN